MTLRDDYNRDGYFVKRGIFPIFSHDLEKIKEVFNRGPDIYTAYLASEAKSVRLYNWLCCSNILEELISLGFSSDVGNSAIAYSPVLHVMSDELRIPNGYNGTAPHQDWSSMQGSLDAVTIWVPLTETKNNFPLEAIRGSHKAGLLDGEFNGSVLEVAVDAGDFVAIDCEPGDVVFMSSFLVHRTGAGSDGLRIAASMRFDNAAEPTFIERGYPCAQKRVVDREIRWKPTVEQVREIFK